MTMRFVPTRIAGVVRVDPEPHADARGQFARLYCPAEFAAAGLGNFQPNQVNLARNPARRTLRGLHFQPPPHAEAKLVRVVQGCAQDVVIDLRPGSETFGAWISVELDAASMSALFVPEGCAHGYLTLRDDTHILYQMGRPHVPGCGHGIRWDDPAFSIAWAAEPVLLSERDATWPDWRG
jgi:dTDP-4-dehydrorhamnose 3,5-epimerase